MENNKPFGPSGVEADMINASGVLSSEWMRDVCIMVAREALNCHILMPISTFTTVIWLYPLTH